ncbi:MAG: BACON domain-containing protein [Bacteroidales bacterium]|nr:BACON domain-containing protein [Bacteroidales bacterium]
MKKKNFFSIVAVALMAVVISFTGCNKEELLTLSPTSQSLAKEAGSFSINVTSNTSWTATADQSWLTVGTASGEDNGAFSVTYQENTTESSRSGNITVTTKDGMVQIVSVLQSGPSTPSNPFIGAWRDDAWDFEHENSYAKYTFNADNSFQYNKFNGSTGVTRTDIGTFSYNEGSKQLYLNIPNVGNYTMSYNFIDATTLEIGGYTYLKQ